MTVAISLATLVRAAPAPWQEILPRILYASAVALLVVVGVRQFDAPNPSEDYAPTVRALTDAVAEHNGRCAPQFLDSANLDADLVRNGVMLQLERRRLAPTASRSLAAQVGSHRVADDTEGCTYQIASIDQRQRLEADGWRVIESFEPIPADQQAEIAALEQRRSALAVHGRPTDADLSAALNRTSADLTRRIDTPARWTSSHVGGAAMTRSMVAGERRGDGAPSVDMTVRRRRRPRRPRFEPLGRQPALDGLRAVAVMAVLLYHSRFVWAQGGFLGVSTFFTLSGFLITSLLLREWGHAGWLDLRRFWRRRFRRLLPASWLTLLLVIGMGALGVWDTQQLRALRGDVPFALLEVLNWHFIAQGRAYGAQFAAPSPLEHFWSLAVEEQFYLVLPVLLGVLLTRRLRRPANGPGWDRSPPYWRSWPRHPRRCRGGPPAPTSTGPTWAPTPGWPSCCSAPCWPACSFVGSRMPGRRRGSCSTSSAWPHWARRCGSGTCRRSRPSGSTRGVCWRSRPVAPPSSWVPCSTVSSGWASRPRRWSGSAGSPTACTCCTGRSSSG